MKIRTSGLTGAALDWAVATSEGKEPRRFSRGDFQGWYTTVAGVAQHRIGGWYSPTTDWAQGGPIIEKMVREGNGYVVSAYPHPEGPPDVLCEWIDANGDKHSHIATAVLIAALRCYVASKLGDEVEIPEELS